MGAQVDPMQLARHGLAAWQRGDVAALADLLDPDVDLLWWTPGTWDCHGRDEVVALLTARVRSDPPAEVDITDVDDSMLLVERREPVLSGPEAALRPATLVRLRDGLVVRMQQYRSREDALADAR
ncbi:MAG: nuclear transport factor 2 family protein [Nocardioidaceae bacterium]